MIARLILFALLTSLMVSGGVWLADHPGQVTLHWLGWRIETSVAVLITLILAAGFVVALVLGSLRRLLRLPSDWLDRWRTWRQRRGYRALADGLSAVALGEGRKARSLARQAGRLLNDHRLTGLLTAQAAQINGDDAAQERALTELAAQPDSAALGLKGLVDLALRQGDGDKALSHARQAWSQGISSPGLAAQLVDLLIAAAQWDEAERVLQEATYRKAMDRDQYPARQAVVWSQLGCQAEAEGAIERAFELARRACRADPALSLAACLQSRLLHRLNKPRKAQAVLAEAWRHRPDETLVQAWYALAPAETALQRVERLSRLTRGHPHAALSHQILGEAALEARLWGQARTHLLKAVETAPAEPLFRALARLERQEHHDEAAATAWLQRCGTGPVA